VWLWTPQFEAPKGEKFLGTWVLWTCHFSWMGHCLHCMVMWNKIIDSGIREIPIQSMKFSCMSPKLESYMQLLVCMVSTWGSVLVVASVPVRGTGIGADLCEQVRMCCIVWIPNTKTSLMSDCWTELWHFLHLLTVLHTM
jgi:hypothetical protein